MTVETARAPRPHLALFSYNFYPEPTGIGYYNSDLVRWFVGTAGWQVSVVTGIPHYPWWQVPDAYRGLSYWSGGGDESFAGATVLRAPHVVPGPGASGRQRLLLDATWLAAAAIRAGGLRRRPHLMLFVAPPFLGGLLALALGRWWRCPVIYHVQDLQIDAAADLGMLPRSLCRILQGIERFILRRVDRVTTISPAMRRRIAAKDEPPLVCALLPNWADVQGMQPHRGSNRYRQQWGQDTVVMYSGNLGRKQGLDDLIMAVCALPNEGIQTVIAGSGAAREALVELACGLNLQAPRLRFLELQPREDLAEFLSAADIHCLPQKRAVSELVMPSKVLNVMAVGRPLVVAADLNTDLARLILEAGCGIVVPPEDPGALATAVAELAGDAQRRDRLGRAGRAWLEQHLGIDQVLGRFKVTAEGLIAARRGHPRERLPATTPPPLSAKRHQLPTPLPWGHRSPEPC